jgi:hypothetical protein
VSRPLSCRSFKVLVSFELHSLFIGCYYFNGCLIKPQADISHLRRTAQHSHVKIEPVNPVTGTFGSSMPRRTVPFSDFLDMLSEESQRGKWYLTTQYEDEETDRQSDGSVGVVDEDSVQIDQTCPPPTNSLVSDFPNRPGIMGNLVLQQCNLWCFLHAIVLIYIAHCLLLG